MRVNCLYIERSWRSLLDVVGVHLLFMRRHWPFTLRMSNLTKVRSIACLQTVSNYVITGWVCHNLDNLTRSTSIHVTHGTQTWQNDNNIGVS